MGAQPAMSMLRNELGCEPSLAAATVHRPVGGLAYVCRHYLALDPRTLGVLRIALGALLLFDLIKRWGGVDVWYVNDGLLPNHRVLWRPSTPWALSYLFALWTTGQVRAAFLVTAAIYGAFMLGWRTRAMHALSWFCLTSLQTRVQLLSNGGDYVFGDLLLWSAFLPLGRRFSIDALLAERRDPHCGTLDEKPVVHLAVLGLYLQLFVIYVFNAISKSGPTWRDGSALHHVLWHARIVTAFGVWVGEHAPAALLRLMSHGAVYLELALAIAIVSPLPGRLAPWPRRLAVAVIWLFHGSLALLLNLGVFSPVMMTFGLILLGPSDWQWLARRCPRLRSRWESAAAHCRAGLQAFVPLASAPKPASPWQRRLAGASSTASQLLAAGVLALAGWQVLVENRSIPTWLRPGQPEAVRAAISYLRLNQGWNMFAPDAPTQGHWLVVDATTASGRHVDPFNELASIVADPTLRVLPRRLGQNVYFVDYVSRIAGHELFHQSLADWIRAYPRRTRRAADRVVRFDVYLVEQENPKPGEVSARNARVRRLLSSDP